MRTEILKALRHLESNEGVRILLAVESGSRAWGFASTDSDWDVRFIYVRPPSWYLSVQPRRDVIELPIVDDLDFSGWDLTKALWLFSKSNPPLLEWLRSPLIYHEAYSTAPRLRALTDEFFAPRSCMYHYLSMTEKNYREYLCRDSVRLKKYFYTIRPVLACRWIERHGTMPPMEFEHLVDDNMPRELRPHIDGLLERKMSGEELSEGPRIDALNTFLDTEVVRLRESLAALEKPSRPDLERLDQVFRATLDEVWGR